MWLLLEVVWFGLLRRGASLGPLVADASRGVTPSDTRGCSWGKPGGLGSGSRPAAEHPQHESGAWIWGPHHREHPPSMGCPESRADTGVSRSILDSRDGTSLVPRL